MATAFDDLVVGAGAGPTNAAEVVGFEHDGGVARPLPGLVACPFGTAYGARVGSGDVGPQGAAEVIAGPGPDPSAPATVRRVFLCRSTLVEVSTTPLVAFAGAYGVNPASVSAGQ